MSQSAAIKTSLTIPGLVICSVTMPAWLLVGVVSVLLLIWCIAIVVVSIVLLTATVVVSIVLIVIVISVCYCCLNFYNLGYDLYLHFVYLVRDY